MTREELLQIYPTKTFSQKFAEKKSAFINLGTNASELDNKERSLGGIFEYDSVVSQIRDKISDKKVKIDAKSVRKIERHFRKISELNSFLDKLITQDPTNVGAVFQQFDNHIRNIGFSGPIMYEISGGAKIPAQETLVDIEIRDALSALETLTPQRPKHEEREINIDVEKLKAAEILASKVIENAAVYENAAKTADNWIKTESRAVAASIKDKSKIFEDKASREHTKHKLWWWLVAAAALGFATIYSAFSFISELRNINQGDVSVGAALLRISVIGALSYAAFLLYQQFNIQRHLYESYKFKSIALATMEELLKTYPDPVDRPAILNKAIDIIFSEPTFREERAVQQRLIDELLDVVKRKI